MRTKTTLLCAAALAAGVASSWAQSNVYSLNIVGYVNQTLPANYSFVSNPLAEDTSNNYGTNVYVNPGVVGVGGGPLDGCQLQLWHTIKWSIVTIDSSQSTGYADPSDSFAVPTPQLTNGLGYLFVNQTGAAVTNTYVGTVLTGTNTVALPLNFTAVGSPTPLAGGIMSVLQLTNTVTGGVGYLDGGSLQFAKFNGLSQITGYTTYTYDSSINPPGGSGFDETNGEPQVALAQGFFFDNGIGAPVTWTQVLQP